MKMMLFKHKVIELKTNSLLMNLDEFQEFKNIVYYDFIHIFQTLLDYTIFFSYFFGS